MRSDLKIPAFTSEQEEVDWVDQNRHLIEAEFAKAFASGNLRRGRLVPPSERRREQAVVSLTEVDAQRARALAKQQGLNLEAYLAELLHKQLQKEDVPAA